MFILFTLVCLTFQLMANTTKTQEVKGKVIDKITGAPIEGVTVSLNDTKTPIGTITDENGEFRLWDVPASMRIRVSVDGYKVTYIDGEFVNDSSFVIEMENKAKEKKKFSLNNIIKNKKIENSNLAVFAAE